MDISDYNEAIFTSWFKLQKQIPSELIQANEQQFGKLLFESRLIEETVENSNLQNFLRIGFPFAAIPLSVEAEKCYHSSNASSETNYRDKICRGIN